MHALIRVYQVVHFRSMQFLNTELQLMRCMPPRCTPVIQGEFWAADPFSWTSSLQEPQTQAFPEVKIQYHSSRKPKSLPGFLLLPAAHLLHPTHLLLPSLTHYHRIIPTLSLQQPDCKPGHSSVLFKHQLFSIHFTQTPSSGPFLVGTRLYFTGSYTPAP